MLGPGAARTGAQLEDRATTQSVTDGVVAPKASGAVEVARTVHNQAGLGIDTVARRLEVVKDGFRPQSAASGRQFVDGADAAEVTSAGGSPILSRAIEIAGAVENEIAVRIDAVAAARNKRVDYVFRPCATGVRQLENYAAAVSPVLALLRRRIASGGSRARSVSGWRT